jgi:hypothetical protein
LELPVQRYCQAREKWIKEKDQNKAPEIHYLPAAKCELAA